MNGVDGKRIRPKAFLKFFNLENYQGVVMGINIKLFMKYNHGLTKIVFGKDSELLKLGIRNGCTIRFIEYTLDIKLGSNLDIGFRIEDLTKNLFLTLKHKTLG